MAFLLDNRNEPFFDKIQEPIGTGEAAAVAPAAVEELLELGSEAQYLLDSIHTLTTALRAGLVSVPALPLLRVAKALVKPEESLYYLAE